MPCTRCTVRTEKLMMEQLVEYLIFLRILCEYLPNISYFQAPHHPYPVDAVCSFEIVLPKTVLEKYLPTGTTQKRICVEFSVFSVDINIENL